MCVVHVIACFVCVRVSHACCARERSDPSSPALRRPLCRFKSCPSEPANSSCSIFIKPLSLKEPYPDHGKSHSSCSHSHALSILALIPPLPALLCLPPHSLAFSHPPFTSPVYLSLPLHSPSLSLSLIHTHSLTHTHTHSFSLSLSLSHSYIHKHTHTQHTCSGTHTPTQSIRVQHTCAGWGGSGAGGAFRRRRL